MASIEEAQSVTFNGMAALREITKSVNLMGTPDEQVSIPGERNAPSE
jgi:hypothetical protein